MGCWVPHSLVRLITLSPAAAGIERFQDLWDTVGCSDGACIQMLNSVPQDMVTLGQAYT